MSIHLTRGHYEVEVMADTTCNHHRLTTFRLVFPRIVLAEFNTHRLFSRNSASSRAIPIAKMVQRVIDMPFVPDRFPRKHKGMQANEWVTPEMKNEYRVWKEEWLKARDEAVNRVIVLDRLGMSKQLVNRILEPFLWHEVIVTATEWGNFVALRAHEDAQNEIRIIAEMILEALNASAPYQCAEGYWHLPFGDKLNDERLKQLLLESSEDGLPIADSLDEMRRMVTVARCARVSYLNFEGKDDYVADLALFHNLKESGHWSPFEHVARAMTSNEFVGYSHTTPAGQEYGWCGNFRGFIPYRKLFPKDVENRRDPRLISAQW
jgi:thymidylate synthase ThyX